MLRGARNPFFHAARDFVANLRRGKMGRRCHYLLDSLLIELFVLRVARFRQPVSEGDQRVARSHLHDLLLVAAMLEHPDEHPARTEAPEVAGRGGAKEEWRIVSGVDVSQAPRRLV